MEKEKYGKSAQTSPVKKMKRPITNCHVAGS